MLSKDPLSQASISDQNEDEKEVEQPGIDTPSHEASDDRKDEDRGRVNSRQDDDNESPPLPDETAPPVPSEPVPPLPQEAPPLPAEAPPLDDDGWEPKWDDRAQAYYFFNRFTSISQWENPRVPEASQPAPPVAANNDKVEGVASTTRPVAGGYDPTIHGDYDPNADYAKVHDQQEMIAPGNAPGTDPAAAYAATGAFNRFTGKWQNAALNPENFSDENKSRRQMNAFFDVDAAANSHDGKSLKAERAGKKLSKQELKAFKEKRREKKEEKRRAWLRD